MSDERTCWFCDLPATLDDATFYVSKSMDMNTGVERFGPDAIHNGCAYEADFKVWEQDFSTEYYKDKE